VGSGLGDGAAFVQHPLKLGFGGGGIATAERDQGGGEVSARWRAAPPFAW
jgi:hypothetical protein